MLYTFDIETIPQDESKLLASMPSFRPAGNLKDPDKIKASIEAKRQEYIDQAALNWKTAEVVMIGYGWDDELRMVVEDEKSLLKSWLEFMEQELVDGNRFAGHNIKGFDLPMIVNRARVHRLTVPATILSFWKGKIQWHEEIYDTLEILSFGRSYEGNRVEDVARVFNLPPKLGSGRDFPFLFATNPDAAIAYNLRDVEIEKEIAKICGLS